MCDGSSLLQGHLKVAKPYMHGTHREKSVLSSSKLSTWHAVATYVNLTSSHFYRELSRREWERLYSTVHNVTSQP
jgi:hypothetical protein